MFVGRTHHFSHVFGGRGSGFGHGGGNRRVDGRWVGGGRKKLFEEGQFGLFLVGQVGPAPGFELVNRIPALFDELMATASIVGQP